MPYMGVIILSDKYHLSQLISSPTCITLMQPKQLSTHTQQNISRVLDRRKLYTGFKHTLALKWVLELYYIALFRKEKKGGGGGEASMGLIGPNYQNFWHWKLRKLKTQMAQTSIQLFLHVPSE
jgi:hypothetical protein